MAAEDRIRNKARFRQLHSQQVRHNYGKCRSVFWKPLRHPTLILLPDGHVGVDPFPSHLDGRDLCLEELVYETLPFGGIA